MTVPCVEMDVPCVIDMTMIKARTLNWISHLLRNKEELTWAGLEREKEEKSAWWRQFEGHLEDAGYDVEEWESIESARSRDFLTMLGCPC